MRHLIAAAGTALVAALCGATDVVWMNTPADALWNFTSLNWGAGAAWTDGDGAVFGASDMKNIEIEGTVAPATVTMTADGYTLGGSGTLSLDGPIGVGDGLSATISASVLQTSGTLAGRFRKTNPGTLTLTGGGSFARIGVNSGKLILDGGVYNAAYPSGAEGSNGNKTPLLMSPGTEVSVTGGATLNLSGCTVMKAGGTLRIENGTVDASTVGFWNSAYTDDAASRLVIGNGGTLITRGWLNAGFNDPGIVTTLVTTGGTLRLLALLSGSTPSFKSSMLFDGGTLNITNSSFHQVLNNLFVKAGPGGMYLRVPKNMTEISSFLADGGETDGGLHPVGYPVLYLTGTSNHRGGTWLDCKDRDSMICMRTERAFGLVPDAPTNNIFFGKTDTANILLTDGGGIKTHPNRTISIAPDATARLGVAADCEFILGGMIHGPTNSTIMLVKNWVGGRRKVVFDPGEGRTNTFGYLTAKIPALFASGVTELTQKFTGDGSEHDNNLRFEAPITITGGVLRTCKESKYLTIKKNLDVLGGVAEFEPTHETLHAFYTSVTTTVANAGTLVCGTFRLAQGVSSNFPARLYLATGGVMRARNLYIDVNNYNPSSPGSGPYARIDFDGGLLAPRVANQTFTDATAAWLACVNAYVLAGGMIVSNDNQVFFKLPLKSGVAHDGGVHKWGTAEFALVGSNTFNGPVVVHQGSFVFGRSDTNFPQDSTFNVCSNGTLNANGMVQTIGRLEGGGKVIKCANLTVAGTLAPHGDGENDPVGTLTFNVLPASLSGDLEIGGNTNGCGCVKFNAANFNISNLSLKVDSVAAFDENAATRFYKVIDAPSGYTGKFRRVTLPSPWQVGYTSDAAFIYFPKGTIISFR